MKHKVIQDFQLTTDDKKIIVLKSGTVLVDYTYSTKNKESLTIDKEIIDNNDLFFKSINWKEELNTYLRQNKIPQPAVITKKLVPFIEEMFVINNPEKETPKEFNISNNSTLEIELENKIKKNDLLQVHLQSEIDSINRKEIELNQKEKNLLEKEQFLNQRENEINTKSNELNLIEINLDEREININLKESNLNEYVSKNDISEQINNIINNIKQQGFLTDFVQNAFNQIKFK